MAKVSPASMGGHSALGPRLLAFASEQLLQAQSHLARQGEARHSGIHEARKCIRRTRATLALGRRVFDRHAKRLDDELGRLCRGLSPLRDAQALIEVLRRLKDSAPAPVRAILPQAEMAARKRRDQMLEHALKRDPQFQSRQQRLLAAQVRVSRLGWQAISEEDVGKAVTRSKRRIDKAWRQIERDRNDDRVWHALRRRLRRLRQQDSLLAALQPDLRPAFNGLEPQAIALGESQDDALLLRHFGRHSPFPPEQRKLLRKIARERLQRARSA